MLASKTLGSVSAPPDPSWDVSNAQFLGTPINFFYVGAEELTANGLFFKPDGTKMYVIGATGDEVNEYNLSTAWNISTAVFLQLKSISAQESQAQDLFFKPDGTKMYVIGFTGDDVNEYNLSTAWDVSTASYVQVFSVATKETNPNGLFFKSDGTKMYVIGSASANVHEYNLSTAWNVSTASFLQSFSVSTQTTSPFGLFFKPDGTKMYIVASTVRVYEYNLSTAWDVSTASYVQEFFVNVATPQGLFFKDDGTVLYIVSSNNDAIYQYQLSTAWNISTATYSPPTTKYFSVATQESVPTGLFFKPDGAKMYTLGQGNNSVYEYNLSSSWVASTASYIQSFSVASQETIPQGLFFKSDGTKMYIIGSTGDDVNEYTLSTAWNISTATYLQNFSVALQETTPTSLFFKPDGLKMYIIGSTNDSVYEYTLSTAWNISTATYLQNFSVASQETQPFGLFFKPDGTKMYVCGTTGDDVNEYTLSTAWNVTTASFVRLFSFASQTVEPCSVFFRDNGLQMYIISYQSDAVWEYDLV